MRVSTHELVLPVPSLGDYIEFHRKRLGLTREVLGQRAFLSARRDLLHLCVGVVRPYLPA